MASKKDEPQDAEFSAELTEAEKIEIEAEARAEVAKALKDSKRKEFKAAAKKRVQAEALFRSGKDASGEDILEVNLLLASHPKYIILDGAVYHSGRKYKVKKAVAQVLLDQMHRGWEQEEARMSPEARGNFKQHREFKLSQSGFKQVG